MNISTLSKMSLGELKATKMIIDKLIESKITSTLKEFEVGDMVKINHKKVAGMTFTVVKVNRKRVRVRKTNSSTTYNVAASLIEKI